MARRQIPTKETLEREYRRVANLTELGAVFGVSVSTISRWFRAQGVEARPRGAESVRPERRRGGRRYKRTGRRAQHVTPEQARRMRELRVEQPEWSLRRIRDAAGATCSRQMVQLILQGKRVLAPEAFPAQKSAKLVFGRER